MILFYEVYIGPAKHAVSHFVALGQHFVESEMNPADFVIEAINKIEIVENQEKVSTEETYLISDERISHDRAFLSQIYILLHRNYLQQYRRYDIILLNLMFTGT